MPFAAGVAVKRLLLLMIGLYRVSLSPWLGGQCRHIPTCSQFAQDAIRKYHWPRALWKITGRLLRCHPFSRGGWDPA